MLKKTIASAAAAVSLAASPVFAQSQGAPVEPASEQVEGSEFRGGFILPAIAIAAIILAILALTDTFPFGEDPESP